MRTICGAHVSLARARKGPQARINIVSYTRPYEVRQAKVCAWINAIEETTGQVNYSVACLER